MMYTGSFYGNQLYIIMCPFSPFCLTTDPADIYKVTQEDVKYATLHPFRNSYFTKTLAQRMPPLSLEDEVNLLNLAYSKIGITLTVGG
ncbi:putative O-linked-mannose beta-1-2-N-acetylglucosaminyltransferase 1-like 1 [Homarus americanus]|uniref:Putative O-linked-mannose beta-1-2-N-acetylglucosaminyltransferase 1-like 1 n=2 Tax=Homarus americanus TaxID=6706 RepID=A0A8J5NGA8_HOMAM|nr:putative O-linked-mannose beta-1-2-N-acetylglucosaminyltransferase 1-like 1 [Homarus americanus]